MWFATDPRRCSEIYIPLKVSFLSILLSIVMSSLVDSIPKPINDEISVPPLGIVPLTSKLGPVCNRNYNSDEPLAVTRAVVNVSGFKDMLLSLPRHIWDDEDQDGNVQIVRPAHDAWGIKKIIFTFCDDFLQKVLDLPWSQQEKWREHLLPIYEACGIKESQVVRSLLASVIHIHIYI